MATYQQGILGAFSGKVGPVIGVIRYGKPYMRSRPLNPKNPRTPKQQRQRNKMALTISLLKKMKAFIHTGWRQYQKGRSAFNAATSYTLTNAIKENKIDYGKLLVSCGTLTGATGATVVIKDGTANFIWVNNSGAGSAQSTDRAIVAIINTTKNEVISETEKADRMMGNLSIVLPEHWDGDEIHTYIGFASQEGNEVSNSVYLGVQVVKIFELIRIEGVSRIVNRQGYSDSKKRPAGVAMGGQVLGEGFT